MTQWTGKDGLNLRNGSTLMSRLEKLPLAGNIVRSEPCDDAVSDFGEAIRCQSEDGRSSAGETNSQ